MERQPVGKLDAADCVIERSRGALAKSTALLAEGQGRSVARLPAHSLKMSKAPHSPKTLYADNEPKDAYGRATPNKKHARASPQRESLQDISTLSQHESLLEISSVAKSIFDDLDSIRCLQIGSPSGSHGHDDAQSAFKVAADVSSNEPLAADVASNIAKTSSDCLSDGPRTQQGGIIAPGTGDSVDSPPQFDADTSGTGGTQDQPAPAANDDETASKADPLVAGKPSVGMESIAAAFPDSPHPAAVAEIEDADEGRGCFSEAAVARLQGAFLRHTEPFSYDLDVSNLRDLVKYLGHGVTKATAEGIRTIVKGITPYEYLNFEEFLSFMEKFLVYESEQNHAMFKKFDVDDSGELSVLEVRQVMRSLDIMPLNAKLQEAIRTVDEDCSGQLGLDEFRLFLEAYQSNEGFAEKEMIELTEIYKREGTLSGGRMPVSSTADALIQFFGVSFHTEANDIAQTLLDRQKKERPQLGVLEGLSFEDLLLLCRQLREVYYNKLVSVGKDAQNFSACDGDGNGTISLKEMTDRLKHMGFEPLSVSMDEVFSEVVDDAGGDKWSEGQELDFDQYFDYLLVFRQREGFLKAQVDDLLKVFNRFDEDASGTISTVELSDIFRHLGYFLKPNEVEHYILQVDDNQSHTLDFKEFLHLMQLHRASEIRSMRDAVKKVCEEDKLAGLANEEDVLDALAIIGCEPADGLTEKLQSFPLDFCGFVTIADHCRTCAVEKNRRMAGFNVAELQRLRESFDKFDTDHSGTITLKELLPILELFGWKPRSHDDRADIVKRLDKARQAAKDAGVEESTELGPSDLNFWEFVQLARMTQRADEAAYEDYMGNLAAKFKFSHHEAAEFHDIFLHWAKNKDDEDDSEDSDYVEVERGKEFVRREDARRLVKSLGLKFTPETKRIFDKELDLLCGEGTSLDFAAFLQLMRWMLDTHFVDKQVTPEGEDRKHA